MEDVIPQGFRFAGVPAGIKKTGSADYAAVVSDRPCAAAGVFTRNAFPAAPVLFDRELLAQNPAGLHGVVINAGCANACTGEEGLADAAEMARLAEAAFGTPARSMAVMSTGVIGPRLPMERIAAGAKTAAGALSADGSGNAAAAAAAAVAIMTTDTRPKIACRQAGAARLWGMAKGAGMIHPDMATMLSVIVTDAAVSPASLDAALRSAVDVSFNSISVDGDMSTNDTVLALANSAAGTVNQSLFAAALAELCTDLAQQIVRDGEGATKFVTIRISGAETAVDARVCGQGRGQLAAGEDRDLRWGCQLGAHSGRCRLFRRTRRPGARWTCGSQPALVMRSTVQGRSSLSAKADRSPTPRMRRRPFSTARRSPSRSFLVLAKAAPRCGRAI